MLDEMEAKMSGSALIQVGLARENLVERLFELTLRSRSGTLFLFAPRSRYPDKPNGSLATWSYRSQPDREGPV